MEEIRTRKKAIRKAVAAKKKLCSSSWKNSISTRILQQIEDTEAFRSAGTILLYYALPDEVQTEDFLKKWSSAKTLVLPLVQGDDLVLKRYEAGKIVEGYRSIPEPSATCEDVAPETVDLAIIPGVAFDRSGNRLGRGKGYYDRILPKLRCPRFGIAYPFQCYESIPTEAFDIPMDRVFTVPRYTHLIFDIDGTLIDTEKTAMTSLQMTVSEIMGKEIGLEELSVYFGIPSAETVVQLRFEDPQAALHTWETHYQEIIYMSHPYPGINASLEKIRLKGYQIGTVTSRSRFEYFHDPNMAAIRPYFQISVCKEDTATHKPTPGPMLAYLKASGADPSRCLYIGDTGHDCHCSKGAGVDFALLDWKVRKADEDPYRDIDYDFLLHNADDLEKLILD